MSDHTTSQEQQFIHYSERFQKAISLTNRKLASAIEQDLKGRLTGPQCYILNIIAGEERATASLLSEKMQVKPSAITVMVDRLVQNEFVIRLPDPQDRRVTLLQLTDNGKQSIAEVKLRYREILAQLITELDHNEQEVFIRLFERIAEAAAKLD
ncbi:MarR family winged helix-turn-helix transcriptional regulator [Paenibacillus sp. GCM10027626]|uniref:MarR family winged helix-turn-helix transcriptional regulator n=1 Tax=Paenibacillus sp. GCM10027626 TaxID=3273411 RepID=UPI0036421F57